MGILERLMNAVTFAEAGLPDRALEMLNEGKGGTDAREGEIKVAKTRPSLSDSLGRLHEAATFAEAGEHGLAREALSVDEAAVPALLVVSHDDSFSAKLREYALDLAGRMGYQIVALSVMETPRGSFLSGETQARFEQFSTHAGRAFEAFRLAAEGKGIQATHTMAKGSVEEAIRAAHGEHRGLELVVSDPASLGEKDLPAEAVSVFALAH